MAVEDLSRGAAFASYVPRAVLHRLASIDRVPDAPHTERYPAALLLVDIAGFTRLAAATVRDGAGAERLSRAINAYLGHIIDLVVAHGGDIAKIVGDALLPVWPATDEDLATATRRAALCGLRIASELGELEVEPGLTLSVKIGLCAGDVEASHVGGHAGRWLFVLAGDGVSQLPELERHMEAASVVASPAAWPLISSRFVGQPAAGRHVRLRTTEQPLPPAPLRTVELAPHQEQAVRAFIPVVCLARLDAGHAEWLGELRRTTVLFANVRWPSTEAQPVELLHRVAHAAQVTLDRHDGWLKEVTNDDKGTTLVAAFGVPPFSHVDDPARAVRAAQALQVAIRGLGLTAGVGVATGLAFCGPVGNARRRDFAVLGPHVNLAARLMEAAPDGDVLCDLATHGDARTQAFDRLPAYVLKGLATPTDVYRVRFDRDGTGPPITIVDRTSELATLLEALDRLRADDGSVVAIEGEPGIGKTRLVEEWLAAARAAGVRTLVGAASEIESATPFHAWRPVLESLLGLAPSLDRAARRGLVEARLGADPALIRLAPLLDPILSLDLPDNDVTAQLTGEVRADNTRDLVVRLLAAEAERGSLLVLVEDAHWLDSASWSLLMRARRDVPRLILAVTRRPVADAGADPLRSLADRLTVPLGPLPRDDAIALAVQRTGATRIADRVAAILDERAEGNPLFIEQLTYAMRDSGRIVVDDGVVRASRGEPLDAAIIPDTVQRVITTRLDQLPPSEAMTIKIASVIGPRFALDTLADIYPLPTTPETLARDLETLARLDLVAPVTGAAERSFQFRHVITQEVAYNLMLSAQSRELHRKLAEWYERTNAADLSPFHAFLAHHWRKAGVPGRAVDHLEAAGEQALRTFANEEAIGFVEQALALDAEAGLGVEPARRARWHLQLGEAYVHLSRYREGRNQLELGLRLLGRPIPRTRYRQMTGLLGQVARQALRRARLGGRVRALDVDDQAGLVAVLRALERLAEASYYSRERLLPLYCVVRILNEAEASGIAAEMARGFAGTGVLFGVVPLPRVAEWYLGRAAQRLEETDDLTTHEIVGIVLGFYSTGAGHWDEARGWFRGVRRIARRLGDRRRLDDAVDNLMELEYLQGSFAAGAALADDLVAGATARNDRRFEAEGVAAKAYCAWQLGDVDEALRRVARLRAMVAGEADLTDDLRIKFAGLQAAIHHGRGEMAQALAACEEAMRLTGDERPTWFGTFLGYASPAEVYLDLWEAGRPVHDAPERAAEALTRLRRYAAVFPIGRPRMRTLTGRHRWLRGRREQALREWREALRLADALSMPYEAGIAHYEIGRHLEPGDPARATHLATARERLASLGAARALAAVEAAVAGSAS